MHYACLGPYSELKDVNEIREARIRAEKTKYKLLRAEIVRSSNACLCLMTHKMKQTEFTLILAG